MSYCDIHYNTIINNINGGNTQQLITNVRKKKLTKAQINYFPQVFKIINSECNIILRGGLCAHQLLLVSVPLVK